MREMINVKNYKNRVLPFRALLTKIFEHFRFCLSNQQNQYIDGVFTEHLISRGINIDTTDNEKNEEEENDAQSHQIVHMDKDNASDTEEIPLYQSAQPSPPQDAPLMWFM